VSLSATFTDCAASLEHLGQAAATTDRTTMQTYRKVEKDGLGSTNRVVDLRYRSVGFEGSGFGFGCKKRWGPQKTAIRARWLDLAAFREKRYSGVLSTNAQNQTALSLQETAISIEPQLPLLQRNGSAGRVTTIDFDYTLKSEDMRWAFEVNVEHLWSDVDLKGAAFLNRSLDVSVDGGRVVPSDQISPLTGRYGNGDFRLKLPRVWTSSLGYEFLSDWWAGIEASGVGAAYQPMGFLQHHGARLSLDTQGRHLVLGYRRGGWQFGAGIRTAKMPQTSRIDHILLGYSYQTD